VGPLAAAASAAAWLARDRARLVVFIGTAGVFDHARTRFAIGHAAAARSTSLVDVAALRGLAERPSVQTTTFALEPTFGAEASVATTSAITVDDALARELGGAGFDLENLELAGVAAACAHASVPCASVLGVSNVVGSAGREAWRDHHLAAARAACDRVRAWLIGGA
jgi:nucleoside phosphorylase